MDALHDEVNRLNIKDWRVRAIVHFMIDAGTVTSVECQVEKCLFDSRSFERHGPGRGNPEPRRLHVDHIVPRSKGGSDRLSNLRLAHSTCNRAIFKHGPMSDAERKKRSEGRRKFLESGNKEVWLAAMSKRNPGWNKKQRSDDRRGGSKKRNG